MRLIWQLSGCFSYGLLCVVFGLLVLCFLSSVELLHLPIGLTVTGVAGLLGWLMRFSEVVLPFLGGLENLP
jgi:hypothetical protein